MLSSPLFWTNLSGANLQLFIGVSMKTLGVSLTWGQVYWRGLPGKLGVGGNYLWCLVIVIYMGLGRAKRLGGRGGFKVIIWGRARHKGGDQFLGGGELTPVDTMGLITITCLTPFWLEKCNIIFSILSIPHNIFTMAINKLTK